MHLVEEPCTVTSFMTRTCAWGSLYSIAGIAERDEEATPMIAFAFHHGVGRGVILYLGSWFIPQVRQTPVLASITLPRQPGLVHGRR